jgi:hypothetical protein
MSQAPKFWEKTIEYAFVIAASEAKKIDLALPLSGKPERAAGDAIFGSEARLVLVEFKRAKAQVESEQSIFHDYEDAKQKLSGRDGHHFLVYPVLSPQPQTSLNLFAETYFSRNSCGCPLDCLTRGTDPESFRSYLETLFKLKVSDGRSSGGQIGTRELAQVLGVSTEGKLLEAVTLQEYASALFPEQKANSENVINARRMRNKCN